MLFNEVKHIKRKSKTCQKKPSYYKNTSTLEFILKKYKNYSLIKSEMQMTNNKTLMNHWFIEGFNLFVE